MSSRAQVRVAVTVLALVLAGAVSVFTLVPWLWWLIFTFGWMILPAFGLLVRGIAGIFYALPGVPGGEDAGWDAGQELEGRG
jgi:hypothetical protein